MGRFYCEDEGDMPYALWEANLERAIKGRRGQAMLHELEAALLALPQPRLEEMVLYRGVYEAAGDFYGTEETEQVDACAIGAYLRFRILNGTPVFRWPKSKMRLETLADLQREDSEDYGDEHAKLMEACGVPGNLAWHIGWLNDEQFEGYTPEERYEHMLAWVREQLLPEQVAG